MNLNLLLLLVLLIPVIITAQEDSSRTLKDKNIKPEFSDSVKHYRSDLKLPPRTLIIKLKDLKKIKDIDEKSFTIIDDSVKYSNDELTSGLSENEIKNYKKNKEELKQLYKPSASEEETYPLITKIRKILGNAQTIGAIVILIMSLL